MQHQVAVARIYTRVFDERDQEKANATNRRCCAGIGACLTGAHQTHAAASKLGAAAVNRRFSSKVLPDLCRHGGLDEACPV